jgi:hypothetical protein
LGRLSGVGRSAEVIRLCSTTAGGKDIQLSYNIYYDKY